MFQFVLKYFGFTHFSALVLYQDLVSYIYSCIYKIYTELTLLWKEQSSDSSSKEGRKDIIPLFFNYKNTQKETAQLFMTRTVKASSLLPVNQKKVTTWGPLLEKH